MNIVDIRDRNPCKGGINKNFLKILYILAFTYKEMRNLLEFDGFFNDATSQFNKPFSEPF
jgi:hypothetical protein